MKHLSHEEILKLKGLDFAKAWTSGQIQISSLANLGVYEFEKDEDGHYIVNDKDKE